MYSGSYRTFRNVCIWNVICALYFQVEPVLAKEVVPVSVNEGADVFLPPEVATLTRRRQLKVVQGQDHHLKPDKSKQQTMTITT